MQIFYSITTFATPYNDVNLTIAINNHKNEIMSTVSTKPVYRQVSTNIITQMLLYRD